MVGNRSLTGLEQTYMPIEAEMKALSLALQKASKFLIGAPRFVVYIVHKPSTSLINDRRLDEITNPRLRRCIMQCHVYDFVAYHIQGKGNLATDSLSRQPAEEPHPVT